jgi:2-(1,2-epoxy-1,2-dihydrophenyl)acetyl-CoA isomerase
VAEKSVLINKQGNICTLTLNRPQLKNALSMDITWELTEAFQNIAKDEEIRVVILEGSGGEFCAGGDMSVLGKKIGAQDWIKWMSDTAKLILLMRSLPQIIICKLQGHALGGGATLLLAGDFIVGENNAKFGLLFVNYGVMMEAGAHYFLPRLVGQAKARELALLGKIITGEEAASIGLIYKSVPVEDVDKEVEKLTKQLLAKPPMGLAMIKKGLDISADMSLERALEWEGAHQSVLLTTDGHHAAIKQFLASFKQKGK